MSVLTVHPGDQPQQAEVFSEFDSNLLEEELPESLTTNSKYVPRN